MLFGYARISIPSQKFDLQIDALLKAGEKKRIFTKMFPPEQKQIGKN